MIGTEPTKSIKEILDCDVISFLLSYELELNVGRHFDDHCKNYMPRVLQHQVYLKEDILNRTVCSVRSAVCCLQVDKLKNLLLAREKIYGFVYDESGRNHTLKIVSHFS